MDHKNQLPPDAATLNAAFWVRHYNRPGQEARRGRALERLWRVALERIAAGSAPEPVLLGIAIGLYDRRDARFC